MKSGNEQLTIVEKEMGINHKDFYTALSNLLNKIPYHQIENVIKFQFSGKKIEIILGAEGVRELSSSMRLPVTIVTLHFFDFSEEEVSDFIRSFNLKFMKGGG